MGYVAHGRSREAEWLHGARAAPATLDGWASNMTRLATTASLYAGRAAELSFAHLWPGDDGRVLAWCSLTSAGAHIRKRGVWFVDRVDARLSLCCVQ